MDIDFIRKRITELRVARDISEYKISTDLGFSKGYIQSITSGRCSPFSPGSFGSLRLLSYCPKRLFR